MCWSLLTRKILSETTIFIWPLAAAGQWEFFFAKETKWWKTVYSRPSLTQLPTFSLPADFVKTFGFIWLKCLLETEIFKTPRSKAGQWGIFGQRDKVGRNHPLKLCAQFFITLSLLHVHLMELFLISYIDKEQYDLWLNMYIHKRLYYDYIDY